MEQGTDTKSKESMIIANKSIELTRDKESEGYTLTVYGEYGKFIKIPLTKGELQVISLEINKLVVEDIVNTKP